SVKLINKLTGSGKYLRQFSILMSVRELSVRIAISWHETQQHTNILLAELRTNVDEIIQNCGSYMQEQVTRLSFEYQRQHPRSNSSITENVLWFVGYTFNSPEDATDKLQPFLKETQDILRVLHTRACAKFRNCVHETKSKLECMLLNGICCNIEAE